MKRRLPFGGLVSHGQMKHLTHWDYAGELVAMKPLSAKVAISAMAYREEMGDRFVVTGACTVAADGIQEFSFSDVYLPPGGDGCDGGGDGVDWDSGVVPQRRRGGGRGVGLGRGRGRGKGNEAAALGEEAGFVAEIDEITDRVVVGSGLPGVEGDEVDLQSENNENSAEESAQEAEDEPTTPAPAAPEHHGDAGASASAHSGSASSSSSAPPPAAAVAVPAPYSIYSILNAESPSVEDFFLAHPGWSEKHWRINHGAARIGSMFCVEGGSLNVTCMHHAGKLQDARRH